MKIWMGKPPTKCDLCEKEITDVFIDGRVRIVGIWACMCPNCHDRYGTGLGMGHGQSYQFDPTNQQYVKTAG